MLPVSAVTYMIENNYYHKRRGFCLSEPKPVFICNSLLEELVELQAELLTDGDRVREELLDVICCLAHLVVKLNFDPSELKLDAEKVLMGAFVKDKKDVLTDTPGFTRNNRRQLK